MAGGTGPRLDSRAGLQCCRKGWGAGLGRLGKQGSTKNPVQQDQPVCYRKPLGD